MKPYEITLLKGATGGSFDVTTQVPSTYEEFDKALGEPGAALDEGIDNTLYRNTYPRIYSAASKLVEERHSFVREQAKNEDGSPATLTKADGTSVPVKESEIDHLKRFSKDNRDALAEVLSEVAGSVEFYVAGQGGGGGGKISKAAEEAAASVFNGGMENVASCVTWIEGTVPGYKVGVDSDGNATPASLARGIQAVSAHQAREARKRTEQGVGQFVK